MNSTVNRSEEEPDSDQARRRRVRLIHVAIAGAATIATLALGSNTQNGTAKSVAAAGQPAHSVGGFAADDPSDPTYSPASPPENTQSQPDPGWNADPGWDFSAAPMNHKRLHTTPR